uniref:Uncharacterized protein n=1 Tax=Ananas comosus var. bracteatus TaxID=296719 RepID=A0A6V7QVJ2_ANACO
MLRLRNTPVVQVKKQGSLQSLVANFASPRAAPLFDAARLWTHKETHTIIYANALSAVPSSLTNLISSVLFFFFSHLSPTRIYLFHACRLLPSYSLPSRKA